MTKAELIREVAERLILRKGDVEKILDAVMGEIRGALGDGQKVELRGLGTFRVTESAPRKGRNPRSGETIDIPAGKRVKFKAGKELQAAI